MSTFENKKIWITGHNGMVGSAILRSLSSESGAHILVASRNELDLLDVHAVEAWAFKNRPDFIFHAAAKVGGIYANKIKSADFIYENLLTQVNVINVAKKIDVQKLLFVATNCTYPGNLIGPIPEDALFSGLPDDAVRAYAVSKLAGIEMCRAYSRQYGCNFISVIPPNLYGINDNYHPLFGHVVAGILRRAHEAKVSGLSELVIWGDGTARRELLWVDDLADAMKLLMLSDTKYDLYNIGCGHDWTISDLTELIVRTVGFKGDIVYDKSKPNGAPRKLLDNTRILSMGWRPSMDEVAGLSKAYQDFLERLQINAI